MAIRRGGLDAPESVKKATEEYFHQEDMFALWLEEECERQPGAFTPRKELFQSWSWWTNRAKEPCGNRPEFFKKLEDGGFEIKTMHGVRGVKGLHLRLGVQRVE